MSLRGPRLADPSGRGKYGQQWELRVVRQRVLERMGGGAYWQGKVIRSRYFRFRPLHPTPVIAMTVSSSTPKRS